MNKKQETLGEALPKEQARVRELILVYRNPELNGAGNIAAAFMEAALRESDEAIIQGDVHRMLKVYEELKGYEC